MSDVLVLVYGLVAGLAVALGLFVGLRRAPAEAGVLWRASAVGVLLFLLWDLLTHGFEPISNAIEAMRDEIDGPEEIFTLAPLLLAGLVVGFGALAWQAASSFLAYPGRDDEEAGPTYAPGPGAGAATGTSGLVAATRARRLALRASVGVGLHGALVGLAIGGNGGRHEIAFPILLAAGLGLLNVLEGRRLAALSTAGERPPALLALVGGAPVLVATAVGLWLANSTTVVAFQGIAAGALLYTVIRLLVASGGREARPRLYAGVALGITVAFLANIAVIAFAGSID